MARKPDSSSSRTPRDSLDSLEARNVEAESKTQYESGLIPLLWLVIPFILILIYGFLS